MAGHRLCDGDVHTLETVAFVIVVQPVNKSRLLDIVHSPQIQLIRHRPAFDTEGFVELVREDYLSGGIGCEKVTVGYGKHF